MNTLEQDSLSAVNFECRIRYMSPCKPECVAFNSQPYISIAGQMQEFDKL